MPSSEVPDDWVSGDQFQWWSTWENGSEGLVLWPEGAGSHQAYTVGVRKTMKYQRSMCGLT